MKISNVYFYKNAKYFNNLNKCTATKFCNFEVSFGSDKLTVDYYDKIGSEQRQDIDFEQTIRQKENFLRNLPQDLSNNKMRILDAGCGTGRDIKYFIEKGYEVDAFDASEKMCKRASEYTGISVSNSEFLTFSSEKKYDGIYARNSLLHAPKDEFKDSVQNMVNLLKPNGIFWATLKTGQGEARDNKGRFYSYYDLNEVKNLLSEIDNISIVEIEQYNNEAVQNDSPIIEFIVRKTS